MIIDEWNETYEAIQKEIRENPDNDSLKLIYDDEISLEEPPEIQIQESDQVNINDIVDNLVGDVEGERDDQIHNSDYKEVVQETNPIRNPEELRNHKSEKTRHHSHRHSHRQIIPSCRAPNNSSNL